MNVLAGLKYPQMELSLVRNFCILIMFNRLGVAQATIKAQAEAAGIPLEEVEASAFGTMSAAAKFVTVVAVVMSVVDVILQVLAIVDVVQQCKKMCDELNTTVRASYKSYFNGIKTAAAQYKAAIAGAPGATPGPTLRSAAIDITQMRAQIQRYGSITQFGTRVSNITGGADNPGQSSGTTSKTDRGFGGLNGTWEVGNWGNTLRFTN